MSGTGSGVVHIAGQIVTVGPRVRQRCGWCGALLIDHDVTRIAVPVGHDPTPAMWDVGALVEVDGSVSAYVPHTAGAQLPLNACGQLDHEVTA